MSEGKVSVNFKTSAKAKERMERMAEERCISLSALINIAVYEYANKGDQNALVEKEGKFHE